MQGDHRAFCDARVCRHFGWLVYEKGFSNTMCHAVLLGNAFDEHVITAESVGVSIFRSIISSEFSLYDNG